MRRIAAVGLLALAMVALVLVPTARARDERLAAADLVADDDLGRQALAPDDGWAAAAGGTTGGSAAPDERVVVVRTRAELVAALAGNDPKIVYVKGTIDAGLDDAGRALTCDDYAEPPYARESYLAA